MSMGKCRHVLSGRFSYGQCSHGNCASCPVEQDIEDSIHQPIQRRASHAVVSGFEIARNYYYHQSHTWARVEYGGWVRVGVDDFALRLLGRQDVIEMPTPGSVLRQGQPVATVKRAGKEASIISPVDGVVVAINHKVQERTFIANDTPYEDGWLMVIQPTNLHENLKSLRFDSEAVPWLDDEAISLNTLLAEESRLELIAAGSETPNDLIETAPEIGWERLVEEFLE
jgi:glycine cleavage system H lipoate-binding protein